MLFRISFCFLAEATSLLESAAFLWTVPALASNSTNPPLVFPKAPFGHSDSETAVFTGLVGRSRVGVVELCE